VTKVNKNPLLYRQRGLSIVEFMVGIAVGLFIVGGATKLFADFIVSNKRLMLETRVNQDLRAAADIVARDVRRAGYWNNSLAGVWGIGSVAITANPHTTGAGAVTSTSSSVSYSYARNAGDALDSNEYAGFLVQAAGGVPTLHMLDGQANPQPITDPGTVRVTAFGVIAASPALVNDLSKYCGCLSKLTCTNSGAAGAKDIANLTFNPAGPPILTIPSFQIVLTGQAVNDSSVTRTITETVRVRNARLTGACPP
jgi:prepilin peptidase dependent protein B